MASNQFSLLKNRRFLPFFIAQFTGAFNDNVFKNALIVWITFSGVAAVGEHTAVFVNMAAGLFILPFFLFSAVAGVWADRAEKSSIMRRVKFAEILIMLLGVLAFMLQNLWGLLTVLFLLGTQAAFFGPVKYALLPQHLATNELLGGNALVEMGTFVAILLGTLVGGVLVGLPYAQWAIGICVLFFALIGYVASRYIPPAPPLAVASYIPGNWFTLTFRLLGKAKNNKTVFLIILGISWFWLLGASYLTQIPTYTKTVLFGDNTVVTALLCMFTFGVALGSLLCERLSGKKVEIGLVPFGALGLSVFGLDLWWVGDAFAPTPLRGFEEMLAQPVSWRIVVDFLGMGVFGGFYIVPLYAMLQQQSEERDRAQMIAANNIMNAIFMVFAAFLGAMALGVANLSIPTFLGVLALMNFLVAIYIFGRVPEFAMRFLIWALMHSFYRIRIKGLEKIPEHGAAVIVCNHVSYVDALILAGIFSRPIRFVIFKPIYDIPILHFIFRTGKAIPIHSRHVDSITFQQAFKEIAAALEAGDLLAIFPEGKITMNGEMNEFKKGIEQIITTTPVPVVPIALRGLWGSFFSRSGKGAFRKIPRKLGAQVKVVIGDVIAPQQVSAEHLFQVVQHLRGDQK